MKIRLKAICYAVWYGLLPWWMYEQEKHYTGSYLWHVKHELKCAWRWMIYSETEEDIAFEKKYNNNF